MAIELKSTGGILEQIKDSNTTVYRPLTEGAFNDIIMHLDSKNIPDVIMKLDGKDDVKWQEQQ